MAVQRYPLEALRQLRDDRAEAQTQELATQVARSQAAEAKLREREAAKRAHAERTAETRNLERRRLAAGEANGFDLLRVADFETGARAQAAALDRAVAEAREALAKERAEEQKLRADLATLEAEAQLVRNHESRFHEHHAELRDKAEEEAALEQWSARRH